ncbi:MAG: glycosyltransferase [Aphanothece sp. CMT-3BRIN-NPC111]|jgi:glycosyltransferase involved in cell wall biosynthesis|nr:glycosyltransferase [Aphanothece sp. CMT-3BRIN-NPC111]
MTKVPPRVALFLRYLGGGGAEAAMANLARGFAQQELNVDFVLSQAGGPHQWKVPPDVRIVDLGSSNNFASLKALMRYLRQEQPVALLSALHFNNEIAVAAKRLSGVSTRVVVCEQNTLSLRSRNETRLVKRQTPLLARLFYPWADGVVAISQGVAKDLTQVTGLPLDSIRVIYNPAITPELAEKAKAPVDHPWFAAGEPRVILGVGKLEPQKDFPTLIRAFAQVRQVQPVRLMILGWGPEPDRLQLEALVQELGLEDDVALPGYVNNPYAYMARAAVFALSSRWEGFGNVIVEAMVVGTPVVSTNCESGPAEILDNGKYGSLVPVGDSQALAEAILKVLAGETKHVEPDWLNQFSLEAITQQYLDVLGLT